MSPLCQREHGLAWGIGDVANVAAGSGGEVLLGEAFGEQQRELPVGCVVGFPVDRQIITERADEGARSLDGCRSSSIHTIGARRRRSYVVKWFFAHGVRF